MLKNFLKDEQGQDLIEYTLLLAFVCLATAALFISSGGSLSGIWITANSRSDDGQYCGCELTLHNRNREAAPVSAPIGLGTGDPRPGMQPRAC